MFDIFDLEFAAIDSLVDAQLSLIGLNFSNS